MLGKGLTILEIRRYRFKHFHSAEDCLRGLKNNWLKLGLQQFVAKNWGDFFARQFIKRHVFLRSEFAETLKTRACTLKIALLRREQGCLVALPVADCVSSFSARFRTNLSNEFLFYGLADIFLQKLKTASEKKAYL